MEGLGGSDNRVSVIAACPEDEPAAIMRQRFGREMSHVLPGSSVVQGGSENGEIVVSELAESAAVVALPPLPDVPMIGRTEEHASVISALRNSSSRVASITG